MDPLTCILLDTFLSVLKFKGRVKSNSYFISWVFTLYCKGMQILATWSYFPYPLYSPVVLWMRTRNLGSRWVRSQSLATRHRSWASKRKCRKYVCGKGQQGTNWRSRAATLERGRWLVGGDLGDGWFWRKDLWVLECGRCPLLCLPLGNRLCLCIFLIFSPFQPWPCPLSFVFSYFQFCFCGLLCISCFLSNTFTWS